MAKNGSSTNRGDMKSAETDKAVVGEPIPPSIWNTEAGARLVEAVRTAGGNVPSRFEQPLGDSEPEAMDQWRNAIGHLVDATSFAFGMKSGWRELTANDWRTARLSALGKLRGQVTRARQELSKEPDVTERINDLLPVSFLPVEKTLDVLLATLQQVEEDINRHPPISEPSIRPQSAALVSLAQTYAAEFETNIYRGLARATDNYTGPFIAYLRVSFDIAGNPKTPAAMSAAFDVAFPKETKRA